MNGRGYRPGDARLPRIAYADRIPYDYAREVRRWRRRMFPVVAVLVVVRYRAKKSSDKGGGRP